MKFLFILVLLLIYINCDFGVVDFKTSCNIRIKDKFNEAVSILQYIHFIIIL
jgi:hypothetical protein